MEYLIGMILALGVFGFAVAAGFDRERAFYPTVAIVVASYYVLFAAMGGSGGTLIEEIAVAGGFLLLALVGYKKSALLVALVIFGHGIFDMVHHLWIENPGMPAWWPGFCMTFDVFWAVYWPCACCGPGWQRADGGAERRAKDTLPMLPVHACREA